MASPVPCAVLMCHAPVVVPAVGGERASLVAATTAAMREAAAVFVAQRPDLLLLVSPHAPRLARGWALFSGTWLSGSLAPFGAPDVRVRLPAAREAARRIAAETEREGVGCALLASSELDHGALVPLAFLCEAGWSGPTLELALPAHAPLESCLAMGRAIAAAARAGAARLGLVASGDLSHRLTADAPGGHEPRAREFDAALRARLAAGDLRGAVEIDPALRELAGEDALLSLATAVAAVDFDASGHRVLSYEAPFGVGYLVAVLHAQPVPIAAEPTGGARG